MRREKVDVADLRIGMYVAEPDRPWLETPFLFQGFPIKSQDEIKQFQSCCQYVYVDLDESDTEQTPRADADHRFSTGAINRAHFHYPHPEPDRKAYVTELKRAVKVYTRARSYIHNLMEDVRLGHSIDAESARDLASQMADSIVRDENALVWLTNLKERDEYTSLHSLNVCILSLLFGRHLGLSEEALHELGFGSLLHDIGKMKIPLSVLNKDSALSEEEMAMMRHHPTYGYEILKQDARLADEIATIAYCHHERVDGSGYPQGLKGERIPMYAQIVSIVDVYDAITSDRVYHMGISPHEALNLMYGWATSSFAPTLLEEFIKCLGIFPVGSLVELTTGEVGVVMTVNRKHHLQPIVTLVLDRDKHPLPKVKLLDLQMMQDAQHPVTVNRILKSKAYGIDVRKLIAIEQQPELHH